MKRRTTPKEEAPEEAICYPIERKEFYQKQFYKSLKQRRVKTARVEKEQRKLFLNQNTQIVFEINPSLRLFS